MVGAIQFVDSFAAVFRLVTQRSPPQKKNNASSAVGVERCVTSLKTRAVILGKATFLLILVCSDDLDSTLWRIVLPPGRIQ